MSAHRLVPVALALSAFAALATQGHAAPQQNGKRAAAAPAKAAYLAPGLVRVKSDFPVAEAVERVKKDVAAKGILYFTEFDQQKLAAGAGIALRPSTLVMFGNPPLGTQFITANPYAGLDWPVRLLLTQDEDGQVWAVYNDFAAIARRHRISDRGPQFRMAAQVIASITASLKAM